MSIVLLMMTYARLCLVKVVCSLTSFAVQTRFLTSHLWKYTQKNAAASVSALNYSDFSDLRTTYVFVDEIAGTSPKLGTIGSTAFSRYTVQICLQAEFDALAKPRYRVLCRWRRTCTRKHLSYRH